MQNISQDDYPNKWWALMGLSLLAFTAFLDFTIVSTAIPFIQLNFKAPVAQLQWINSIYGMLMSMSMIMAGRMGDRFGRRRVYYLSFVLFAIAAIGAGMATNLSQLIFFRGLQGLSGACVFTLSAALLPSAFPDNEQSRAVGIYSAITGLGLAVGPFLGGLLITLFNWHWVFWINLPIIVIGISFCFMGLEESPISKEQKQMDWPGFILLSLSIGCLIYGLLTGGQYGWHTPACWINLGTALVAFILLLFIEKKQKHPLLDLTLFNNRYANFALLIALTSGTLLFVFFSFFAPLFLKIIKNQSALVIGLTLLIIPCMQVLLSLCLTQLLKIFCVTSLILIGLFSGFLSALMHCFFDANAHFLFILIAFSLLGIAWGIGNTCIITTINQYGEKTKTGGSIGTIFTLWNITGTIFLSLTTVLYHSIEKLYLTNHLNTIHTLSIKDKKNITQFLTDPDQAINHLHRVSSHLQPIIDQMYKRSFIYGFHSVAWTIASFIGLLLIIGVWLKKTSSA